MSYRNTGGRKRERRALSSTGRKRIVLQVGNSKRKIDRKKRKKEKKLTSF